MELRPDGSLLVRTALSMSRLQNQDTCLEPPETARLVQLTLGGDSSAFEQIIRRYETRVMALAARLLGGRDEAGDAAQEVFLKAFKYLHRLRSEERRVGKEGRSRRARRSSKEK